MIVHYASVLGVVIVIVIVIVVMMIVMIVLAPRTVELAGRLLLEHGLGLALDNALLLDLLLAIAARTQHERFLAVVQLVLAKQADPIVRGEQG